jgi:integrase
MAAEKRLTALEVSRLVTPGMHRVDDHLYLQVRSGTSRSWIVRYTFQGRPGYLGLGGLNKLSLADARSKAKAALALLGNDIDPVLQKRAAKQRRELEAAKCVTFREAADRFVAGHRESWRSDKHRQQWDSTLATYAFPVIGNLPVNEIDIGIVLKVIEPIWSEKPETASRLRGRIETVIDWATARGYRSGDNPARWRGLLENLLPAKSKVRKVRHHPALPHTEIGAFMVELRAREGAAASMLQFAILCAARTGEVLGSRWSEIDLKQRVWTVPADRMKAGREHRVPLSASAVAILEKMAEIKQSDFVFPGDKSGQPFSNMAMLAALRRMNRADLTTHGFRSTFRTWAADQPGNWRDVAEAALAHVVGDDTERAYNRGDLFEKRRKLMDAWARYCSTPARGDVIPMRAPA